MNRQQRRAVAAENRKTPRPKEVTLDEAREPEMSPELLEEPGTDQRLEAMLTGKVNPPNQFAAYIVEKIRGVRIEREKLTFELENGKRLIASMERKLISLESSNNNYLDDLREWDVKEGMPAGSSIPEIVGKEEAQ